MKTNVFWGGFADPKNYPIRGSKTRNDPNRKFCDLLHHYKSKWFVIINSKNHHKTYKIAICSLWATFMVLFLFILELGIITSSTFILWKEQLGP